MKRKSWLKVVVEKLAGKEEAPEPPDVFRALARDFSRHNPEATVGDWIELFTHGCREAWRGGYRAGFETKMLGSVELPPPIVDDALYEEEAGPVDLDAVVPLQQGGAMRNVSFTDDHGLVISEED
jgi:hypothetical protein